MTRCLILIALLAAPAVAGESVREIEPNDDPLKAAQKILPGQTFLGEFAHREDVDCVVLECAEDAVLSFRLDLDEGVRLALLKIGRLLDAGRRPGTAHVRMLRYRVPAGRHLIEMRCWPRAKTGSYRLAIAAEEDAPDLMTEPDDKPQDAHRLEPGRSVTAWLSHPFDDVDRFDLRVAERGIYRLEVERLEAPEAPPGAKRAEQGPVFLGLLLGRGAESYQYEVDETDREFHFFPVLDPGSHALLVKSRAGVVGAPYRLSLERFPVRADPDVSEAAHEAVDRGVAWLLEAGPDGGRTMKHETAARATALLALAEGGGDASREDERARKVEALVEALAAGRETAPDGSWEGKPLERLSEQLYDHAIATLALAEVAAAGNERALGLAREGVRFLLASQLSEKRCEAWGVVPEGTDHHGGWRYTANAESGDISVTGWCVIALYAAAAAGVAEPGMVEAVDRALDFLGRCGRGSDRGFLYQTNVGGTPTSVQNSIGALLAILFGREEKARRNALSDLDAHLCAGTQTGHGGNAPFYYWYYATRANYLRGGYAWEAWRAVTLAQLIRRQEEDGSWAAIHMETEGGRRYATGMAVMILRLCLGQPPRYLSREVEGF